MLPAGVGMEVFGTAGSHLLVDIPALFDRLLGHPEQAFGLGRIGVGQRAVAKLAVDIVGKGNSRSVGIEQERVVPGGMQDRVVSKKRPVPARDGAVLLDRKSVV